jgi:hypothetical protein
MRICKWESSINRFTVLQISAKDFSDEPVTFDIREKYRQEMWDSPYENPLAHKSRTLRELVKVVHDVHIIASYWSANGFGRSLWNRKPIRPIATPSSNQTKRLFRPWVRSPIFRADSRLSCCLILRGISVANPTLRANGTLNVFRWKNDLAIPQPFLNPICPGLDDYWQVFTYTFGLFRHLTFLELTTVYPTLRKSDEDKYWALGVRQA